MPAYILHGFRWPRDALRVHIITQNIDDAATNWLIAPGSPEALLDNFTMRWPAIMEALPKLRFVEQYDPEEEITQPYAYVCDTVHEVKLSAEIDEIRGGVTNETWAAISDLRDRLAPEERLGWFVVVCGDVNRFWSDEDSRLLLAHHTELTAKDSKKSKKGKKANGVHQTNGSGTWSMSAVGRDTPSTYGQDATFESPSTKAKRSNSISRFRRFFGGGGGNDSNSNSPSTEKKLKKSKSEIFGRPKTSSGASATALSPNPYAMSPSPPPPLPGSAY